MVPRSGLLLAFVLVAACRTPNLLVDHPPRTAEGLLNVVVEIPAGTNAKWEVDKRDGVLRHEMRDGRPRVVRFLPYPANYGMVPRTLLPKADGGDGDPLDVLLIGPARPRGSVVPARLLGVLRLRDGGERDDKLIAVATNAPLDAVTDLRGLDAAHPGVTRILETWMTHYKGAGVIESSGFAGREVASEILRRAIAAWPGR